MKVSAVIWKKKNSDGLYPIRIKLYADRKNKYIATGLAIPLIHWSEKNRRVLRSHPMHERYNTILTNLLESYNSTYTHQDILEDLASGTLGDLFNERIRDFQSKNRISEVKRYTTIIKHLKELQLISLPLQLEIKKNYCSKMNTENSQ